MERVGRLVLTPCEGFENYPPGLAEAFPDSRLVEILGSYTLMPIDRPAELTRHLREFIAARSARPLAP